MSFKKFGEYFTERTKNPHGVVSDDKGFASRDYDGGLSLKPKPQTKEHCHPGDKQKQPGLMTADGKDRGQPLGDMSTPGMTPNKVAVYGEKPKDKTKKIGNKKKKKLPTRKAMTENFLDETKKMTNAQFAKHMLEDVKAIPVPKVRDLYGKEYTPEPAQTMKYVAGLMLTRENMMGRMVRELKRNGGFAALVAEVLQHPEAYECLVEAAQGQYGEVAQRKLGLLFEGVSPPRVGRGPASAGAPGGGGGLPGGAFGGGSAPMQGPPAAGITGGPNNGGGMNVNAGGGAAPAMGGMQGMGEDDMPKMGDDPMMGGMGHDDSELDLGDDEHSHHGDEEENSGEEDSQGEESPEDPENLSDDSEESEDEFDSGEEEEEEEFPNHHKKQNNTNFSMKNSMSGSIGMNGI